MVIMKGPDGLDEFSDACAEKLIIENPIEIKYPDDCSLTNWPVDKIKELNKSTLDSLRNSGNVYTLYTKDKNTGSAWIPMYVGQRKSEFLRDRMTQHLIKKCDGTASMFNAIKDAVLNKKTIAISYIKVEPESLRLYVEETIIAKRKDTLKWNTHG
ncbi:hypothetical protein [Aeromonas veronii]|uniref:hypothetical protein n=1 Tax=Aeromonas veronii TaxID=654 RepID=UPI003D1B12F0